MKRLLTLTLTPAALLLAAAIVIGCGGTGPDGGGGGGGTRTSDRATADTSGTSGERSTTTASTAPPSTSADAQDPTTTTAPTGQAPGSRPTTTAPPEDGGGRYLCPEGGIDAVRALQDAVDQGHQPWRVSPEAVAAACTFGVPVSTVEPAGADRYRVTETATGDQVMVTLAQPLGPGTIWVVTERTAA